MSHGNQPRNIKEIQLLFGQCEWHAVRIRAFRKRLGRLLCGSLHQACEPRCSRLEMARGTEQRKSSPLYGPIEEQAMLDCIQLGCFCSVSSDT